MTVRSGHAMTQTSECRSPAEQVSNAPDRFCAPLCDWFGAIIRRRDLYLLTGIDVVTAYHTATYAAVLYYCGVNGQFTPLRIVSDNLAGRARQHRQSWLHHRRGFRRHPRPQGRWTPLLLTITVIRTGP